MPAVKKVEQKIIRLIEKSEAIAALEVLYGENELIHFDNGWVYYRLSNEHGKLRKSFHNTYNHDCIGVLRDVFCWCTYILTEARYYSAIEIYDKYAECISLIDKQPMKMLKAQNNQLIDWKNLDNNNLKYDPNLVVDFDPTRDEAIWLFKGFRYKVNPIYSDEEKRLLILEDFDNERQKFETLKAKFDGPSTAEIVYERQRIPEKVRIEVWRRDGGKCARCGSRERLEYDHIVPISRGGSNTARNIELLCESCNRAKSNNIV
jgi:5-methylcytosine-specific restriction endonuclease McrA